MHKQKFSSTLQAVTLWGEDLDIISQYSFLLLMSMLHIKITSKPSIFKWSHIYSLHILQNIFTFNLQMIFSIL